VLVRREGQEQLAVQVQQFACSVLQGVCVCV
jgi:hypothetical protein